MTRKNYLLPTLEQCFALSDETCRQIMELRDPKGVRAQKNWELTHQPELIRQYMTMRSFTQIAQIMRSRLEWSYKTYANRYRDWFFPVDRVERELVVMDLYARVGRIIDAITTKYMLPQVNSPLSIPSCQAQLYPVMHDTYHSPLSITGFFPPVISHGEALDTDSTCDPFQYNSCTAVSTWSNSGTSWSGESYFDEPPNNRLSLSTSMSSLSQASQDSILSPPQTSHSFLQYGLVNSPQHDAQKGLWNSVLRVIPCQQDHSHCPWDKSFSRCSICGFSQCHAIMINAKSIRLDIFAMTVSLLRDLASPDYAGNHPLAFLMAAGVSLEYFKAVLWDVQWSTFGSNVFSQSPLHVLDAQGLGDGLVELLAYFPQYLSLRDSKCRTFLHYLFSQPLENGDYLRVLQIFPNVIHYLLAFDTNGKKITNLMQEAIEKQEAVSVQAREKISAGLKEVNHFIIASAGGRPITRPYGFVDIARGNSGNSQESSCFLYQCRVCGATDAHSDSYYDQMLCACDYGGIDRNAPDEQGWTAAHLLVTHKRQNRDSKETPTQTTELFRLLIFSPELREALHVEDPNGNSLVYNIATRGFCEILECVLRLEEESRRRAMVNSFGRTGDGQEQSVLAGVEMAIAECERKMQRCTRARDGCEKVHWARLGQDLNRCRNILKRWGAEWEPDMVQRWRIY
ncbi:unnamed protein product [Blumeria hordei]|uniref:Uncharacterized protein n=1 Tax=Blumeria hordei TaxID=2867405 RepID=A0A383UHI9_BLUHO|nr:unnamed protein product [Blumeria hordei]